MTPKEARLIIRDGGLRSLIECTHPDSAPTDDCIGYLIRVHAALKSMDQLVRKIARKKYARSH